MSRSRAPDPAWVSPGFAPLGRRAETPIVGWDRSVFELETGPIDARFKRKRCLQPPMEREMEPDQTGFRRISARVEEWSCDLARLVCAGAGARGRCVSSIHSSISSISRKTMAVKQLNKLDFEVLREVEPATFGDARLEPMANHAARKEPKPKVERAANRGEAESRQSGAPSYPRLSHSEIFYSEARFSAPVQKGHSLGGALAANGAASIARLSDRAACSALRTLPLIRAQESARGGEPRS